MRYQGKITDWKDDQGFGFVMPNGGGKKAFVHINNFSKRISRPTNGDLITYELATDQQKRAFAKDVLFVRRQTHTAPANLISTLGNYFGLTFSLLLGVLVFIGKLPFTLLGIYLALSIIAFVAYGLDKSAARKGHWRTKESTLHLLSLIGGWPGALLAQKKFHHKSSKKEFQMIFWATVVINVTGLIWLINPKNNVLLITAMTNI